MSAFNALGTHPPLPMRQGAAFPVHDGKVFFVTGAAGGVGAAIVETLVAAGARVAATDHNENQLQEVAAPFGDAVLPIGLDVTDHAAIAAAVEQSVAWAGRIDGAVNAAAVALHAPPLDTGIDVWRTQFDINVYGVYEVSRLVAKAMIAAGRPGAIVNVASEAGKIGHAETLLAYSATKAAIINLSRMLSVALARNDINVNSVCPGSISTPMLKEVAEIYSGLVDMPADEIFDQMVSSQLKRRIEPVEVARTVSFLLSDDAIIIRGQAVNIDGGDTPY